MKGALTNAASAVWFWRLSIIRCAIYGGIVSWGVFKAGTNGFDGLDQMTPLQKIDLGGDMLAAFGGVLLAFLDNSITRITNGGSNSNQTDTMKKITATAAIIALIAAISFVSGCNGNQQRIAYTTLASVEMTTTAAVDGYYSAVIKGIANTNGIPKVSKAYNDFQKAFVLAVDLAQNNTNALAPLPLQQEASDVISLVGQFYNPSLEKITPTP